MPGKEAGASTGTDVPQTNGSIRGTGGDVVGVWMPSNAVDVSDMAAESPDRGR
jgi:hypothetical protein